MNLAEGAMTYKFKVGSFAFLNNVGCGKIEEIAEQNVVGQVYKMVKLTIPGQETVRVMLNKLRPPRTKNELDEKIVSLSGKGKKISQARLTEHIKQQRQEEDGIELLRDLYATMSLIPGGEITNHTAFRNYQEVRRILATEIAASFNLNLDAVEDLIAEALKGEVKITGVMSGLKAMKAAAIAAEELVAAEIKEETAKEGLVEINEEEKTLFIGGKSMGEQAYHLFQLLREADGKCVPSSELMHKTHTRSGKKLSVANLRALIAKLREQTGGETGLIQTRMKCGYLMDVRQLKTADPP